METYRAVIFTLHLFLFFNGYRLVFFNFSLVRLCWGKPPCVLNYLSDVCFISFQIQTCWNLKKHEFWKMMLWMVQVSGQPVKLSSLAHYFPPDFSAPSQVVCRFSFMKQYQFNSSQQIVGVSQIMQLAE